MTVQSTGYLERAEKFMNDLVDHGWGTMTFTVRTLNSGDAKIVVESGKQFVFIVEKKKWKYGKDVL